MKPDVDMNLTDKLKEVTEAIMEPLHSDLADDPDFLELVVLFSSELPDRTQSIERAYQEKDISSLKRLAHQLKGAAGSYGFHSITDAALELETVVQNEMEDLQKLETQVKQLTKLCQRAHMTYREGGENG